MNKTKFEAFVKLQRHIYHQNRLIDKLVTFFQNGDVIHNPLFTLPNVLIPKPYEQYSAFALECLESEVKRIEMITETMIEDLTPSDYCLYLQEHKFMRKYIIKSVEEECGEDYFYLYIPNQVNEQQIHHCIEIAIQYARMPYDCVEEDKGEYDEHFEEMYNIRYSLNGQQLFMYYIQKICGWKMENIVSDFEFEW